MRKAQCKRRVALLAPTREKPAQQLEDPAQAKILINKIIKKYSKLDNKLYSPLPICFKNPYFMLAFPIVFSLKKKIQSPEGFITLEQGEFEIKGSG